MTFYVHVTKIYNVIHIYIYTYIKKLYDINYDLSLGAFTYIFTKDYFYIYLLKNTDIFTLDT